MNANEYSWRRWMVGVVGAILVFVFIAWAADAVGKYVDKRLAPIPTPQILPIYDPGLGLSPLQP